MLCTTQEIRVIESSSITNRAEQFGDLINIFAIGILSKFETILLGFPNSTAAGLHRLVMKLRVGK